jgi:hypothetical protein
MRRRGTREDGTNLFEEGEMQKRSVVVLAMALSSSVAYADPFDVDFDYVEPRPVTYCHAQSAYPPPTTTSSNGATTKSTMACGIPVEDGDLVQAVLTCNLRNVQGGTTYMRVMAEGPVLAEAPGNWITHGGTQWGGGTSQMLFRADADGLATVYAGWHVSSGTGSHVYCNIIARVLGK